MQVRAVLALMLLTACGDSEGVRGNLTNDSETTETTPTDPETTEAEPTTGATKARADKEADKPSESANTPAETPTSDVGTPPGELHQVRAGLFRGAHPDRAGLMHLKSLGVKTILSLQQPEGSAVEGDKKDEIVQEQADAKELGLTYVSVPMTSWSSTATYDAAWNTVKPMLEKPDGIYVHCKHGHDRTGLIIALERVLIEGKSAAEAKKEMVDLGHSQLLFMIGLYFDAKTKK